MHPVTRSDQVFAVFQVAVPEDLREFVIRSEVCLAEQKSLFERGHALGVLE